MESSTQEFRRTYKIGPDEYSKWNRNIYIAQEAAKLHCIDEWPLIIALAEMGETLRDMECDRRGIEGSTIVMNERKNMYGLLGELRTYWYFDMLVNPYQIAVNKRRSIADIRIPVFEKGELKDYRADVKASSHSAQVLVNEIAHKRHRGKLDIYIFYHQTHHNSWKLNQIGWLPYHLVDRFPVDTSLKWPAYVIDAPDFMTYLHPMNILRMSHEQAIEEMSRRDNEGV